MALRKTQKNSTQATTPSCWSRKVGTKVDRFDQFTTPPPPLPLKNLVSITEGGRTKNWKGEDLCGNVICMYWILSKGHSGHESRAHLASDWWCSIINGAVLSFRTLESGRGMRLHVYAGSNVCILYSFCGPGVRKGVPSWHHENQMTQGSHAYVPTSFKSLTVQKLYLLLHN